jgi:hypothetical protein
MTARSRLMWSCGAGGVPGRGCDTTAVLKLVGRAWMQGFSREQGQVQRSTAVVCSAAAGCLLLAGAALPAGAAVPAAHLQPRLHNVRLGQALEGVVAALVGHQRHAPKGAAPQHRHVGQVRGGQGLGGGGNKGCLST